MNNHICKAKSLGTGEWVQGYYVQKTDPLLGYTYAYLVNQGHDAWTKTQLSSFVTWHQVDPDTVCRCTGLNDKHGNPIFENDMLRWYSEYAKKWMEPCIVKYGEFNCSCCEGVYGWYFEDGDIRDIHLYEICGNKFDNTKLMEGQ